MKKFLFASLLSTSLAFGEVISVLPFIGTIDYGANQNSSSKESSIIYGAHTSVGTLAYLLELEYSHISTEYKDANITSLNQNDISLAYAYYTPSMMYKVGFHYVSTNDTQLGDGVVGAFSLQRFHYILYDKLRYGLDTVYSYYGEGHDENYNAKAISILQLSPYISYYKSINLHWGNNLELRFYLQNAESYVQKEYSSFEVSNTLYYNSFILNLKYFQGEMRTGVKNGVLSVFNTLNLNLNSMSAQLSYYLNAQTLLSASYTQNNYREYDVTKSSITQDNSDTILFTSLSYRF